MPAMTRTKLEWLVHQASFSVDSVAIENRTRNMTGAQQTRAIVERAVEFLVGNGLLQEVDIDEGLWMTVDPPYDADNIEPKEE